jgi:hypothetical protein
MFRSTQQARILAASYEANIHAVASRLAATHPTEAAGRLSREQRALLRLATSQRKGVAVILDVWGLTQEEAKADLVGAGDADGNNGEMTRVDVVDLT